MTWLPILTIFSLVFTFFTSGFAQIFKDDCFTQWPGDYLRVNCTRIDNVGGDCIMPIGNCDPCLQECIQDFENPILDDCPSQWICFHEAPGSMTTTTTTPTTTTTTTTTTSTPVECIETPASFDFFPWFVTFAAIAFFLLLDLIILFALSKFGFLIINVKTNFYGFKHEFFLFGTTSFQDQINSNPQNLISLTSLPPRNQDEIHPDLNEIEIQ